MAKKIVRLTESDLVALIKTIIKEEGEDIFSISPYNENLEGMSCKKAHQMATKIVRFEGKEARPHKEGEKFSKQRTVFSRLNELIKELDDPKKLEIMKKIRRKMENCMDNKRDVDGSSYMASFY